MDGDVEDGELSGSDSDMPGAGSPAQVRAGSARSAWTGEAPGRGLRAGEAAEAAPEGLFPAWGARSWGLVASPGAWWLLLGSVASPSAAGLSLPWWLSLRWCCGGLPGERLPRRARGAGGNNGDSGDHGDSGDNRDQPLGDQAREP